jgi:hypothetical protein
LDGCNDAAQKNGPRESCTAHKERATSLATKRSRLLKVAAAVVKPMNDILNRRDIPTLIDLD